MASDARPGSPLPAPPSGSAAPSRAAIAGAYAGIWLVWGSTYLAIAWTLESLPPFLMAGVRFLVAGAIMLLLCAARGLPMPARSEWLAALLTGGLLFVGGNGGVCWAEQYLPSGLVALVVASVPSWMVLFDWLRPGGVRPGRLTLLGLVLGFAGVAILVAPRAGDLALPAATALAGLVPVAGSACWALGSILSRRGGLPASPFVSTGAQMIAGGALLALLGAAAGEPARLRIDAVGPREWLALAYLVVFGSLVAFTCYAWLLRVSTPAKVSTYAYVNPVVAVALGSLFGEPVHPRLLVAGTLIVAGVAAITARRRMPRGRG